MKDRNFFIPGGIEYFMPGDAEAFDKLRAKVKKLFRQQLTRKSWLVVRKNVLENLEAPNKAQHAEGRIGSLSGNHPLNALVSMAQARKSFETCASALSFVFARFDVRGYEITVRDVSDVVKSLRGQIVLAVHKGKVKKWLITEPCLRRDL